jgi:uncharacterized integral membrane protein
MDGRDPLRDLEREQRGEPEPVAESRPAPDSSEKVFVTGGVPWGVIIGLVLLALVIVLAFQNTQQVRMQFLTWSLRAPLVVVILISIGAAVILDEIAGFVWRRRRRRRLAEKEELRRLRGGT